MSRKKFRTAPKFLSGQLGPGDGEDPRFDRDESSRHVPNRKALQLCAQVRDCLTMCLAECADELVRDLQVESVVPAPDTRQLLVTVSSPQGADGQKVLTHITRAGAKLRLEMAAAIHRKRTPRLRFQLRKSQ
jgi:ribosome-binding factor A